MEANSSSSKPERKIALQVFAQNIEDIRPRGHQGIDKGVGPTPQSRFRKETIPRWNQSMEMVLMVIFILVIILATKPWTVEAM